MKLKKISTIFRRRLLKVSAVILLCSILVMLVAVVAVVRVSTSQILRSQVREMNAEIKYESDYSLSSPKDSIQGFPNPLTEDFLEDEMPLFLATNWYYIDKDGVVRFTDDSDMLNKSASTDPVINKYSDILSGRQKDFDMVQPITSEDFRSKNWSKVVICQYSGGGFFLLKYAQKEYYHLMDDMIKGMCNFETVDLGGRNTVIHQDGYIISPIAEMRKEWDYKSDDFDIEELIEFSDEDTLCALTHNGTRYYTMYSQSDGYYVISLVPRDDVIKSINAIMAITGVLVLVLLIVIYLRVNYLTKKMIVKNIDTVNSELSEITSGKLDTEIDVRDSHEFNQLSDGINSTVNALKGYIDREANRLDRELELAHAIQNSALPNVFPPFPDRHDIDIYAYMNPAKQVGGDFYDFFFTDDARLVFLIADVSDKGIPAAMFMMKAKTLIKSLAGSNLDIKSVITTANSMLCEDNSADMFVTLWCAVLNTLTGELSCVNAGHCRPLLKRSGGEFEYLTEKADFVVACEDDITYHSHKLILKKGDALFLYTDGVTEAVDTNDKMFGEDGLLRTLNSQSAKTAEEICSVVETDIMSFSNGAAQTDDITMLAFVYNGSRIFEEVTINAKIEELDIVYDFLRELLVASEFDNGTISKLSIAFDEICANIVRYAYPNGTGKLTVGYSFDPATDEAAITFTDNGIPFNPMNAPDPDLEKPEDRSEGGLGIFLVRKFSDRLQYEYTDDKNILTIIKKREPSKR